MRRMFLRNIVVLVICLFNGGCLADVRSIDSSGGSIRRTLLVKDYPWHLYYGSENPLMKMSIEPDTITIFEDEDLILMVGFAPFSDKEDRRQNSSRPHYLFSTAFDSGYLIDYAFDSMPRRVAYSSIEALLEKEFTKQVDLSDSLWKYCGVIDLGETSVRKFMYVPKLKEADFELVPDSIIVSVSKSDTLARISLSKPLDRMFGGKVCSIVLKFNGFYSQQMQRDISPFEFRLSLKQDYVAANDEVLNRFLEMKKRYYALVRNVQGGRDVHSN